MNTTLRRFGRFAHAGFTLVELLIVVIILAILAAIIIPQFSSSALEAREAALDANLATMRSAIELYRVQHAGVYPGRVTAVSTAAACGTGTPGAGTGGTGVTGSQALIDQLSKFSDAAGTTCSTNVTTNFRFGPYLRGGIPNDPIGGTVGSLAANITTTIVGSIVTPTAAGNGWLYDAVSGQIMMNSSANDISGRPYHTH